MNPAPEQVDDQIAQLRAAGDTRLLYVHFSDVRFFHPPPPASSPPMNRDPNAPRDPALSVPNLQRAPNRKERRAAASAARRHRLPLQSVRALPPPDRPPTTSSGLVDPSKAR